MNKIYITLILFIVSFFIIFIFKNENKKLINNNYNSSILNKIYICKDPMIYIVDNFISDLECTYIIGQSKDKLIKTKVVSGSNFIIKNNVRNNSNYWINFDNNSKIYKICKRISSLVNMPLSNSESLQVIHYNHNEKYKPHYDGWYENDVNNMSKGQRLFTCIIYLNDVEAGGETVFPKLKIKIKPKKGRILVFSNTYKDTEKLHKLSLHEGTNVIKGEKWACNLWFRNKVYQRLN